MLTQIEEEPNEYSPSKSIASFLISTDPRLNYDSNSVLRDKNF